MNMQHIRSIDLYIEELVLHGFAHEDRSRIGEDLQKELQRLFTEQGIPQVLQKDGSHHIAQLHADTIIVKPGGVETLGKQLARSLYAGLSSDATNGPTRARKA